MIYVCDSIMGSGKSQSAIAFMNEHPERKFIYLSPYLDEAKRIRRDCADLHFVEPQKLYEFGMSKALHAKYLIEHGCNVASTHQAFAYYTDETIAAIRAGGYTLILDEDLSVLEDFKFDPGDLAAAVKARYLRQDGNLISTDEDDYTGKLLSPMLRLAQSRTLEIVSGQNLVGEGAFWAIPQDLIEAFEDVYILTYLFQGSDMDYFLQMHNISFERINISRTENGGYRFDPNGSYVPAYVSDLANYIHICDHAKLNAIGNHRFSLSMNWCATNKDGMRQLQKNIQNYFRNVMRDFSADARMWSSYKDGHGKLRGSGYSNSFITLNTRATNDFRHKRVLAYAVNLYMNVSKKQYYNSYGIEVDEDRYALATMIQWIWRSAIRDGEEIWIYVPSRRMRELLQNWIADVSRLGSRDQAA